MEQALVQKLTSFGNTAVPHLVEMLAYPDIEVAQLAARALRDIDHIDSRYLPQIIKGLDRNLDWLPPALGRIDSPEAAKEAVARYLVSESAPHNQEAYAVKLSGRRAIPYIIDAAKCTTPCSPHDHYFLGRILGEMEEEKSIATKGLVAILKDASTKTEAARGVLRIISFMDPSDVAIEGDLLELRNTHPELNEEIDNALVEIGGDASAEVLTHWLELDSKANQRYFILKKIAALGPMACDAGFTVLGLLQDQNWDVRNAAARALGYIEYQPSTRELIQLLEIEEEDVRLSWIAAESLGRMRMPQATGVLSRVSNNHWYPPVRQAAAQALNNLDSGASYVSRDPEKYFGMEFYAYDHLSIDADNRCEIAVPGSTHEPSQEKAPAYIYRSLLENSACKHSIRYSNIINPNSANEEAEYILDIDDTPVALRIEEGWLVGTDCGEWGGELAHVQDDGTSTIFLQENIQNIFRVGKRYIAVTGLSHLALTRGIIFDVFQQDNGEWTAKPWRALPRAPETSFMLDTNEVLVKVEASGSILVSASGAMRMAPCIVTGTKLE